MFGSAVGVLYGRTPTRFVRVEDGCPCAVTAHRKMGRGHQNGGHVPSRREPHAVTIGSTASIVKRLARSVTVADEGRYVDCLAPGDPGSRARVHSRNLAAGE